MSSAALQSVPHQSTSVATKSAVALSSGRPYTPGMSQPRDGYFSPNNASPSSRRSSRRPGAGNSTYVNHTTPQTHNRATVSSPTPSTGSRRHALSASNTRAVSDQHPLSSGDPQRGLPPIISPRTSSNRASYNDTSLNDRCSSRRSGNREISNSPRPTTSSDAQHIRDRQKSNQSTPQSYRLSEERVAATSRARRRQDSQGEVSPESIVENRDHKAAVASSGRRKTGTPRRSQTPTGPSREASEVLNRIIISHPEVDIERERERMAEVMPVTQNPPIGLTSETFSPVTTRGTRSRHDYAPNPGKFEKNTRFGEYYLGGTLGEGEFGKVKMGWKQEGGVQVAIKLIRRDSMGTNPSRLAKIYREIAILREISHPNIVRLHEMVETEKQIGIILEYASGGELFDYILNHRYLKDNSARRLFAQLVSGVGYLHKKGIVHRDLKLENLLLDRNRNIIITDFGFANTFNADDELSEEIEYNLSNKEYVKKIRLDKILPDGHRRGDLMQTSCGSPCYAAPELVVSDSLYTGRKVDVWSCGVILYAMLAGYLPFDDDPANPEGDNINLLYKYIVSTPLTFPDYVSPHARDLLRRILVPDPRKRADLFEVARHSWLVEYAHVVSFITSRNTKSHEISTPTNHTERRQETYSPSRSASVREPSMGQKQAASISELPKKYGKYDDGTTESHKTSKDNKRRTVQVEYVAPRSETQRGPSISATSTGTITSGSKKRTRPEVKTQAGKTNISSSERPLQYDVLKDKAHTAHGRRPSTAHQLKSTPQSARRDPHNSNSEKTHHYGSHSHPPVSLARPTTGESLTSSGSRPASMHLTSRGSYSQPLAPELAGTNVQGQMTQPKNSKTNHASTVEGISKPGHNVATGRIQSKFGKSSGKTYEVFRPKTDVKVPSGHRRSNTIGGFFSRTNSVFGIGGSKNNGEEKPSKKYPPVSMSGISSPKDEVLRPSVDSRRSTSFGFGKKRSGSTNNSQSNALYEKPRRFSLLPTTFTLKAIGIGKEGNSVNSQHIKNSNHSEYFDQGQVEQEQSVRLHSATGTASPSYDGSSDIFTQNRRSTNLTSTEHQNLMHSQNQSPPLAFRQGRVSESESSVMESTNNSRDQNNESQRQSQSQQNSQKGIHNRGVLQKNNRRFAEAYEQESGSGYGATQNDHAGSSGAARKVMDFFRRRARDRGL
ncbi:putative serine threonine protein kinase [Golovinomyces cichoracearum]|uniref:Serine/threonine-protein kinase ATG1 n=1 Tax=Golovinomyces cichoracearum TaxID=62708 RepID=A0A420HFD8_9PEZI|nr:putative serine threonine protein kinase [Golovinomyces cichoracearum]